MVSFATPHSCHSTGSFPEATMVNFFSYFFWHWSLHFRVIGLFSYFLLPTSDALCRPSVTEDEDLHYLRPLTTSFSEISVQCVLRYDYESFQSLPDPIKPYRTWAPSSPACLPHHHSSPASVASLIPPTWDHAACTPTPGPLHLFFQLSEHPPPWCLPETPPYFIHGSAQISPDQRVFPDYPPPPFFQLYFSSQTYHTHTPWRYIIYLLM